jgi:hypothetical protein
MTADPVLLRQSGLAADNKPRSRSANDAAAGTPLTLPPWSRCRQPTGWETSKGESR